MNSNPKVIDISSPIGNRLAQIALFERLQEKSGLHPGQMVKDIVVVADKIGHDPIELAKELKEDAFKAFPFFLQQAARVLKGERTEKPHDIKWAYQIRDHFGLDPWSVAASMKTKAKFEGFDPVEALEYVANVSPTIVEWAFDVVIKALKAQS